MANTEKSPRLLNWCLLTSFVATAAGIVLAAISFELPLIGLAIACGLVTFLLFRTKSALDELQARLQHLGGEHRDMLEAISQMPTAFSMFDTNDRLVAWNSHYEAMYPGAFEKLAQTNKHDAIFYADLLRASAPDDADDKELEAHVLKRTAKHHEANGSTEPRKNPDGSGWQDVTRYKTDSGAIATLAIDITERKNSQLQAIRETERRKSVELKLHTLSNIDTLSGAMSRRAFLNQVSQEIERSCRYDNPMCLLVIDIDRFKLVNNERGHLIGDQVISLVSSKIRELLRTDVDVIGRLGAEEFGVLLPQIDTAGGIGCAQRIRQTIAQTSLKISADEQLAVTVSIGVSSIEDRDLDVDTMLDEAMSAVTQAKEMGRDQVALYGEQPDLLDEPETLRDALGEAAPLPTLPAVLGSHD